MSKSTEALAASIDARFGSTLARVPSSCGELTYEVTPADLVEVCVILRDEDEFQFKMLMDVCGVDYLHHGATEWKTSSATDSGFSRGVEHTAESGAPAKTPDAERRFAAVYHLQSIEKNRRLRLRAFSDGEEPPVIPSVVDVWNSANWYEREAFDLFGILFDGHPDLRRLLTDYGFIGHPFRKDFPLIGNVEVRYDPEKGRVVYQPVSIEPRTLVPKVIRDDNRYEEALKGSPGDGPRHA